MSMFSTLINSIIRHSSHSPKLHSLAASVFPCGSSIAAAYRVHNSAFQDSSVSTESGSNSRSCSEDFTNNRNGSHPSRTPSATDASAGARASNPLAARIGAKQLVRSSDTHAQSDSYQQQQEHDTHEVHDDLRRVLTVGLLGYPNAGKSSLTNQLIKNHVTAVSSKRNTTVKAHLGAYTQGRRQLVFVDLPGVVVQHAKFKGQASRILDAWSEISDVDLVLMVVDAEAMHSQLQRNALHVLHLARQLSARPAQLPPEVPWQPKRAVLALNKVDRIEQHIRKPTLQLLKAKFLKQHPFQQCYAVSSLTGEGIPALRAYLLSQAAPGDWWLPAGHVTNKGVAELACELVREQLYRRLNKTIPYELEPEVAGVWKDPEGVVTVDVTVPVRNAQVRMIVVGTRGSVIQDYVTVRAQEALQEALKINVKLRVEVKICK